MPVKLGHLPRRTCSACNAMIGPDDQTDLQYQARGCGYSKVKRTTGQVQLEDLDLILREKASLVWACGAF